MTKLVGWVTGQKEYLVRVGLGRLEAFFAQNYDYKNCIISLVIKVLLKKIGVCVSKLQFEGLLARLTHFLLSYLFI